MNSIENRYIQNIDPHEINEQGFNAEDVVIDFFRDKLSGMDIRYASAAEDSGQKQIVQDAQIDAVAYIEGRSAMGIQITTAADKKVRAEKMKQVQARPFLRLAEMNSNETAIPRILIFIDPDEVKSYSKDRDFTKHEKLTKQILDSCLLSLQFDLTKTKNPLEQKALMQLMGTLEQQKKTIIH